MLKVCLFCAVVAFASTVPIQDKITPRPGEACGYESCPETPKDVLNVHLVPHTHDDVGWLKTVDQYYYGSMNTIQKAGVQYILDSVIRELWEDPKRRFIYVETAFFWKWWVRQSDSIKDKVHTLVRQGRLQFVGGAWSMNDEAASHYQSTIDQFTLGLEKLNKTFGECGRPRVGWQIDPFGHSREFASLLAGMGFDGLFLGRIDYQDKAARLRDRNMEVVWRGDDDIGKDSDIFTGILYNTYSPPRGFCFDILCDDEPIIDDPDSPLFNVDERVATLMDYVKKQADNYRTNNVILTMGGDFTYQDASMWYKNLDKLIEYSNLKAAKDGLKMKFMYSTPTCYLKAVRDADPVLPTKQDDFFPYASDKNSFWTGYFTSRPTTKYFEREANNYLQVVKQLQVLSGLDRHNVYVLDELRGAMGIMQHHDAITGTEKQHVARDYERILNQAVDDALIITKQAFNKIRQGNSSKQPMLNYDRCHFNESSCRTSEKSTNFIVTIYNSLDWKVVKYVEIPVIEADYQIYDHKGVELQSYLIEIPENIIKYIPTRKSNATHLLYFMVELSPLSMTSYYVKKYVKDNEIKDIKQAKNLPNEFGNYVEVEIDKFEEQIKPDIESNGNKMKRDTSKKIEYYDLVEDKPILDVVDDDFVRSSNNKLNIVKTNCENKNRVLNLLSEGLKGIANDKEFIPRNRLPKYDDTFSRMNEDNWRMLSDEPKTQGELTMSYGFYPGCVGNNEEPKNRSSGAYIFRPNATNPRPYKHEAKIQNVIDNEDFRRTITNMGSELSTVQTVFKKLGFTQVDWFVRISVDDGVGKDVVVTYKTGILNNGQFYTDSNGRQILKRVLNKRPQWNVTLQEPVAGNFYPVVSEIYIENDKERFTVLTDRSEGGSSLVEGEIQLALHRRLLHDDAFGVDEALNESTHGQPLPVVGTHLITRSRDEILIEKAKLELSNRPVVFISDAEGVTLKDWVEMVNYHSFASIPLPNGLHLLTLEPWGDDLLLRIENYLSESSYSTIMVDLTTIFNNIKMVSLRETTLAANEWAGRNKWNWKTQHDFARSFNDAYGMRTGAVKVGKADREVRDNGFVVYLKAKQIRTFVISYELV